MKIYGNFEKDQNFITVYSENRIYKIARSTGDWGFVRVGEMTATGHVLDQETYDKWASECSETGTFELQEKEEGQ